MANEPITPVTPVIAPTALVEAVQPAPVVAPTVVAPAVEAAPAPVVEAVAPKTADAVIKAPDTILGDALNKPVEAPKAPEVAKATPEAVVEAPKVETKTEGQSAEPAPPPVYDPFTLPEGITLDTERVGKFTEIMSELELGGKISHDLVQQFGQKAVDLHISEVKKATEDLTKKYLEVWDKQKLDWKDTFLKDPELGGNRFQTTVDSALTFIRTHGGTPEQQTEFKNLMETSGLGNHPAMIRLLANAGRTMAEGKPLAASKPVPATKSKVETMYGKSA